MAEAHEVVDEARYASVWQAALALYVEDCGSALHGTKPRLHGDHSVAADALADLLTDQVQLSHLCDALGLDTEYMAARIMRHIERPPSGRYRTC